MPAQIRSRRRRGLTLVFRTEGANSRSLKEIWQEISPAAVLSHRPIDADEEEAMRAAGVQAVAILFSEIATSVARLIRPDALIGSMQAKHLIAAGHTRLGYACPAIPSLEDFETLPPPRHPTSQRCFSS